jgi:putative ABC transport system permease protein
MRAALTSFFLALEMVCPPQFRREYGAAMRRDFEAGVRDELRARGRLATLGFACGAYADLLLAALREFTAMLVRDFTFAFRSLRKTPLFAVIVVTTLALAIAANASVFSVLRAVILAPLPYPAAERLVALTGTKDGNSFALSLPDFRDLRARATSFAALAAFSTKSGTLTGRGLPLRLLGVQASPGLFETLGVAPLLGRVFATADGRPGAPRSIVISEALWRGAFGADLNAIGTNLTLDDKSFRVIGVMPGTLRQPNFDDRDLEDESFWVPLDLNSKDPSFSRGAHYFQAVGRLRPRATLENARVEAATIYDRLRVENPVDDKHFGVAVESAYETIVGSARPLLVAIFAAVAGVLLVACANVANLLLSRAASRDREFAIRTAVGASRGRLAMQLLVETFALTAFGGAFGGGLAVLALRAFVASSPAGLPRVSDVSFDGRGALYTLGIVAFCTVVAGVVPAFSLSRRSVGEALKSSGGGGEAARGARVRGLLVVAEVALTLALVVSSGLVVRSFFALTAQPLGFEPAGLTAATVQIPPSAASDAAAVAFISRIGERVRALPGVTDAAWSYSAPFTRRSFELGFDFAGRRAASGDSPASQMNVVSPEYFETMRQAVIAGRTFVRNDFGSLRVAVVNEAFVRRFLGGRHALGAKLMLGVSSDAGPPRATSIAGIVADARTSYATAPLPTIYLPLGTIGTPNMLLSIRARPGTLRTADVGAVFASVDPLAARPKLTPFASYVSDDTAQTRLAVATLGSLAFVALALSLAGIYAVVSYGVARRTHEFGIRMALGARAWDVVRSAIYGAMRLVAAGVLAGIVIAASTTHLLAAQLYDVAPLDPLTFGCVTFALALAALVAALVPASRATRVDPAVALRYE